MLVCQYAKAGEKVNFRDHNIILDLLTCTLLTVEGILHSLVFSSAVWTSKYNSIGDGKDLSPVIDTLHVS